MILGSNREATRQVNSWEAAMHPSSVAAPGFPASKAASALPVWPRNHPAPSAAPVEAAVSARSAIPSVSLAALALASEQGRLRALALAARRGAAPWDRRVRAAAADAAEFSVPPMPLAATKSSSGGAPIRFLPASAHAVGKSSAQKSET